MRTLILLTALLLSLESSVYSQSLRKQENTAFKDGEKLSFDMHYGFVHVGEASLEIMDEDKKIGVRDVHHIVGLGVTNNFFNVFFKVRDRYETYLDKQAIVPWLFIRRVDEDGYKFNQNVAFNNYTNKATSEKTTISIPSNAQDMVSAFYYARTLDLQNAKVGDVFPIDAYMDDEIFNLALKFSGRETIKTDMGTFKCLKFQPMVQKGRVFKDQGALTVWISDDANKILVRAQGDILVGSVRMDLKKASNLASPLSSKIK